MVNRSSLILPGADRYYNDAMERQRKLRGETPAERLIARADEVSIFDVLEDFFDLSLPRTGDSFKSRCPFAYEHADGGLDKGWRTYPGSNSSMCFVLHGYMGSVRLIQNRFSIPAHKAAEKILRNYGLLRPKPYRERFQELLIETSENSGARRMGNPQHAAEALHVALKAMPNYTARQFDDDVMAAMTVVLEKLNEVSSKEDPELVRDWLRDAKKIMASAIERKL